MPLIQVVISLIVVGVLLWLINTYIPMDGKIKNILNIVVVVAVVLWLLSAFGVLHRVRDIRVSSRSPFVGASGWSLVSQPAVAPSPGILARS